MLLNESFFKRNILFIFKKQRQEYINRLIVRQDLIQAAAAISVLLPLVFYQCYFIKKTIGRKI